MEISFDNRAPLPFVMYQGHLLPNGEFEISSDPNYTVIESASSGNVVPLLEPGNTWVTLTDLFKGRIRDVGATRTTVRIHLVPGESDIVRFAGQNSGDHFAEVALALHTAMTALKLVGEVPNGVLKNLLVSYIEDSAFLTDFDSQTNWKGRLKSILDRLGDKFTGVLIAEGVNELIGLLPARLNGVLTALETAQNGADLLSAAIWNGVTFLPAYRYNSDIGYQEKESCTLPGVPQNISASDGTHANKIEVTWDSVSGAGKYGVFRRNSSNGIYKWQDTISSTTYNNKVSTTNTYYYSIIAVNSCGKSDPGTSDSGYKGSCSNPSAPTGLSASDGTYSGKIRLSWNSIQNAIGYEIYASATAGGTYTLIGSTPGNSYDVTTSVTNTTYFKIKAQDSCGKSDLSTYDSGYISTSSGGGSGIIDLPRTGQTTCYDSSGTVISCSGTGQDGDIQAGVAWPSPRFTNNGDGTITDNLTGLMWLQDANCFGTRTWSTAVSDANTLANGSCGLSDSSSAGDWRLPNVNELESLVNAEESNTATWLNTQGFTNVRPSFYWSGTTYASNTSLAWAVYMRDVYVSTGNKSGIGYYLYIWPVRAVTTTPAQVWKTGQTTSYETGDDGDLQKGVALPSPRFTDNGNGTITDNLTDLIWLKDANCIATSYTGFDNNGSVIWQSALDFAAGINDGTYSNCGAGFTDWRFPNRKELHSLTDYSQYNPALPSDHPFTNVQSDNYWSATTDAYNASYVWHVNMNYGYVRVSNKSNYYYVWPVRGGQ